FDVLRVDRVEIRCDRANAASVRIPERLGFRPVDAPDAPADLLVFSRSREIAPEPITHAG
ncbi:MAG TPA: GNAT family N-acetyltransferase, partial [Gemmatimonadaceae bacterium]|nr:GNAT family N-acetyltransferase [Gemmatimonadaceae bacterium]